MHPLYWIDMKEMVRNKIYEIRMHADITQEALSGEVGVSRQTIVAIEKGNYVPSVLLALKLAKFFKRPVEDLFSIQ